MERSKINVAAAAGLSVHLPLYWLTSTQTDACGNPEPLTAIQVGALFLSLVSYLLVPFLLSLLSRFPLATRTPLWLSIPAVGSGILVLVYLVALAPSTLTVTVEGTILVWLALSLWTMPAAAAVYYFGALVRLAQKWHRGPHYDALSLRK